MTFRWGASTAPFTDLDGAEPARFALEQVDDDRFRLLVPFRYQPPTGPPIEVTPDALGTTDLASIQTSLTWFMNRHGRHTPAALVHDLLVGRSTSPAERAAADERFHQAMADLDVPPVRRLVMWSAVTLASRWAAGGWSRAGVVTWGLASVAGTALLVHGVVHRRPGQVVVALVGPAAAAPLWGRQAVAGVVGGYALWVVVLPTAASLAGYGTYWAVEEGVRRLRTLGRRRGAPPAPGPVPFAETA